MEYGKYIVVQNESMKFPVIFPGFLNHEEMVEKFGGVEQVVSGGFFYASGTPTMEDPQNISITVFRGPDFLGLESHRGDGYLIKEVLRKIEK